MVDRVAAIYDVHGNLPALEAVLHEVEAASVDAIVIGGDVIPGPMTRETLNAVIQLDKPVHFLQGNGESEVLAALAGVETGNVPERFREVIRWVGEELGDRLAKEISGWPQTVALDVASFGPVLFCHATPLSNTEIFTRVTPEERVLPMFEASDAALVICGHTHMQFDRTIGTLRVVNAGSVGMPFGEPGAYWLLIGPEVEFRMTRYDLADAAERVRATAYPQAAEFADGNILRPPSAEDMVELFEQNANG